MRGRLRMLRPLLTFQLQFCPWLGLFLISISLRPLFHDYSLDLTTGTFRDLMHEANSTSQSFVRCNLLGNLLNQVSLLASLCAFFRDDVSFWPFLAITILWRP